MEPPLGDETPRDQNGIRYNNKYGSGRKEKHQLPVRFIPPSCLTPPV